MKICVAGAPKSGKSTLAQKLASAINYEVVSTDDWIGKVGFREAPEAIIKYITGKDDIIVEGVNAARMLNKGFTPDLVVYLQGGSTLSQHKSMKAIARDRVEKFKKAYPLRVIEVDGHAGIKDAVDQVVARLPKSGPK